MIFFGQKMRMRKRKKYWCLEKIWGCLFMDVKIILRMICCVQRRKDQVEIERKRRGESLGGL